MDRLRATCESYEQLAKKLKRTGYQRAYKDILHIWSIGQCIMCVNQNLKVKERKPTLSSYSSRASLFMAIVVK